MDKHELKAAFAIAKATCGPYDHDRLDLFYCFGLRDFEPVHVQLADVAELIRWQCRRFDGKWDMPNLDEIAQHGRKRFIIVD